MANIVLNTLAQSGAGGDNTLTLNGTFAGDSTEEIREVRVSTFMTDITTDSDIYIFPDVAGILQQVSVVLQGSISNLNIMTVSISGIDVEGPAFEFTGSSGEASKEVFNPTGLNTFTSNDNIKVNSDGGAIGGPAAAMFTFTWLPN